MAFTKHEYYEAGINNSTGGYNTTLFGGQTFTPVDSHIVCKVGFLGIKTGTPTGDGYIDLYNCNQSTHLPTGVRLARATFDVSTVAADPATSWVEALLDAYVTLTAGVEYAFVLSQPSSIVDNFVQFKSDTPTPTYTRGVSLFSNTGIANLAVYSTFDYQFREYSGNAPTVTTQAVSSILETTATGNGNITSIGDAAVTEHGVCWNRIGTPTISDSHTDDGAVGVGAFTSSITGLTSGLKYFVRAYAVNVCGISYGNEVTFGTYIIYPTLDISRATSLVHRYNRLTGEYTLEIGLGEVDVVVGTPYYSTGTPSSNIIAQGIVDLQNVADSTEVIDSTNEILRRYLMSQAMAKYFGIRSLF